MVRNRHQGRGFSLIELLVVMALVGIMVTLAAPSYSDFVANQRVRTNAQTLLASLMYARSEAIKVNGNVTVTAAGGGWGDGWAIGRNGTDIKIQQALEGITVAEAGGNATLTYDGRGRLTGANAASFAICDTGNRATKRTVQVDLSGRPKLTKGGTCP